MFCSTCGSQVLPDSLRCTNCGNAVNRGSNQAAAALQSIADSSAVKGLAILVVSFFTMPVRTVKVMAATLRSVGARGAFDTSSSDVPHLSWFQTAGIVFVVFAMLLTALWGLFDALTALKAFQYSASEAIKGFLWGLVKGLFGVITVNWVSMWLIEWLGLFVGISNNIKKIAGTK